MKSIITTLLLFFSLSSFAQQTNETIVINGITRNYIQYLPTGFDSNTESLPVVFCIHGLGGTNAQLVSVGFNLMADTARFIVIYPQGVLNPYNQTSWNNGTLLSSSANDLSLFNQLIDSMIISKNANPARIYSTGFSMGSIMSYNLACNLNSRIAAIATMSGTMSTSDLSSCVPAYVTPVIHFHGTVDPTVPYDSSPLPSLSLVPQTLAFWKNAHGCLNTSDSTRFADTAADGLTVDRFVYNGCSPNSSLEFIRINGGDHSYFYKPLNDFTEAIEAWRFLSQWSHESPATASIHEQKEAEFNIVPNPNNGHFNIKSNIQTIGHLYNTEGRIIKTINLEIGDNLIENNELTKGVYFLKTNQSVVKIAIL